jgi:hypothetical protein
MPHTRTKEQPSAARKYEISTKFENSISSSSAVQLQYCLMQTTCTSSLVVVGVPNGPSTFLFYLSFPFPPFSSLPSFHIAETQALRCVASSAIRHSIESGPSILDCLHALPLQSSQQWQTPRTIRVCTLMSSPDNLAQAQLPI